MSSKNEKSNNGENNNKDTRKMPHMKQPPGVLSRSFFCWMFPLFYNGNYRDLEEYDLVPARHAYDSKLVGDKLER